ncbi:hypothetical protein COO91_08243 [Nostoc flagelliforme CCNUN1]|uniref:Uncharacterized protein n=1 Tax=Nostoc flagelliforme CCNUN1 TaxID=2038116 RepID=A0A2K8T343_9NOSO|nr:hypothetical protein COO91_08243 [Nostoc flagelliforme CCNUN1]
MIEKSKESKPKRSGGFELKLRKPLGYCILPKSVDRKLLPVDEIMRVSAVGFGTGNHSQLRSPKSPARTKVLET